MVIAYYQTINSVDAPLEPAQLDAAAHETLVVIQDNMTIINTHLGDLQQEFYSQDTAYPLLTKIFFGDYGAAAALILELPPEEVFSRESPLIAGTAAEGWEDSLAQNILISTEDALAYAPDRAEIHFMSGWANWLLDNTGEAVAAVMTAAKLAPSEPSYQRASLILQTEAKGPVDANSNTGTASNSGPVLQALEVMNLRRGPGSQYEAVGSLAQGDQAPVIGRSEDGQWWLIALPPTGATNQSLEAWVSANPEYTAVDNADPVPIIEQ